MTRLSELEEMRARIDAEIERERQQLWGIARLRDDVDELLAKFSFATAETLSAVAKAFDVTEVGLIGTGRATAVIQARQVACWLLRAQGLSLPEIGRIMCRDHTTVLHSVRRVAESPDLGLLADRIRGELAEAHRAQPVPA